MAARAPGDPSAHHDFVQSLFARIDSRLRSPLDVDVQIEIARLTRLLTAMPREAVADNRELFEVAYDLVAADKPNLVLVRSLIGDLIAIYERSAGGFARLILPIAGRTPLNAVLSALLTIIAMSFAVVLVMEAGPRYLDVAADTGFFSLVPASAYRQLLLMMHAAFLGSFVSIVVRLHEYVRASTLTPLMIYVAVVTRPVVAVLFSVLVFSTLKSGLVSVYGIDLGGPNAGYLAWAIGFLCGFSERLARNAVVGASRTLGDPGPAGARTTDHAAGDGR